MPQDFIISGQTLTDIGDAIREKGGAEGGLTPEAMPAAIRAITTGTWEHDQLSNRDLADQHPISAISQLTEALAGKAPSINDEEVSVTNPWSSAKTSAYVAASISALGLSVQDGKLCVRVERE